ncbi:GNAT family N-acetyltransferase [Candidatus Woesearchaeota archaeon]|jgi:ribosomal protein S18 acetylase RimI-like enzyme|nr:GNAT family N-acetyltransferase [Candidatus Woesearchaeota archaeon]
MAKIQIKEVDLELLDAFIDFPNKVYSKNKYWAKPIKTEQKKFFDKNRILWKNVSKKLFLAVLTKEDSTEEIVGRIGAFIDKKYLKQEKVGYFGFFESINSIEVAKKLIKAAETYLKQNKIKKMRGPINGTISYETGLLIKNFEEISAPLMNFNHKYYSKLLTQTGLIEYKKLFCYKINLKTLSFEKIKDSLKEGFGFRMLKIQQLEKESKIMAAIINKAFIATKHFQFRKHDPREFLEQCLGLKQLFDKKLTFFLEDKINKKECGIVVVYPNYNIIIKNLNGKLNLWNKIKFMLEKRKLKKAKLDIIAIHPTYFHKGLGKQMMNQVLTNLKNKGFEELEYSWVLEDNIASIKLAEHYGGKVNKTYALYEKKIE